MTIAAFITNVEVEADDETCAGTGDGSITMSATAPDGQVKYSIDGGVNYQGCLLYTSPSPPRPY